MAFFNDDNMLSCRAPSVLTKQYGETLLASKDSAAN